MKPFTRYSDNPKMNTAPMPKAKKVKMGGMTFTEMEPPKNTYEALTFTAKLRSMSKNEH